MSDADSSVAVEYRPIPGFPGYRVGSDGTVWTQWTHKPLGRGSTTEIGPTWKQLSQYEHTNGGYVCVHLRRERKAHIWLVHRVVLTSFVGVRPKGMQCRHLNGNPKDNRLENLQWGTAKQNCEDKAAMGTQLRGTMVKTSYLTESIVTTARIECRAGVTVKELALRYGSHYQTMRDAITGRTFAHVSEPPVLDLRKTAWKQINRMGGRYIASETDVTASVLKRKPC